jgi:DHA2 family multidrug resistance protein-like MFS transporter
MADDVPSELPATAAHAARESLTGAMTAAGELPDHLSAAVLAAARDAFSSGLHTVAAVTGVVVAGMAVLVVTQLRRIPPLNQAEAPEPNLAPATAPAGAER